MPNIALASKEQQCNYTRAVSPIPTDITFPRGPLVCEDNHN